MTDHSARHPITLKPVVYRLPGMESVRVTPDVQYASNEAGPLTLDVYSPHIPAPAPMVLLVTGYPDVGVPRLLGCACKEMAMMTSLSQLLALCGMAAVTYTAANPAEDGERVLEYVAAHAGDLGVDPTRVGLWAVSGHVPAALAMLIRNRVHNIRAAVLSNGFMLDLGGSSTVADAAQTYGFVNASAGASLQDFSSDLPLFIARAGRDEFPGLNAALDRFIADALARNLDLTVVNHSMATHAFEVNHDSDVSRHIVRQMLEFMRFWLGLEHVESVVRPTPN